MKDREIKEIIEWWKEGKKYGKRDRVNEELKKINDWTKWFHLVSNSHACVKHYTALTQ